MLVPMQVHDVGAPPVKLHAGQASQWHRRNYDADGNSGYISTAARKDAEVTGVCWGKLGTGELAICRTAQQLQIWRSDYINHDLGMKPTAVADRARWPVLFDIAPETSACDARILVLSDSDELVVPIVQPEAALPCLRGTASFRLSGQASASVQRTPGRASAFITPASTVTGQPNRSPLPVDSNAAQHAPAAPSEAGPSLTEGTPAATAAPARVAASSSAAVHATPASGGNTPPVRHNSSSRAPGAALSAALLQPLPSTGTTQCSAGQRLAARHSIGAGSGNRAQTRTTHTARMHTDTIAGSTPASAATTSSLHGRTDAEAPDHTDRPSSDPEACDGADTDTGSAPPSRQSSVEPQQPISNSGRPSEHGLNNTFVEIAQSPQRLSRPARYESYIGIVCNMVHARCYTPVRNRATVKLTEIGPPEFQRYNCVHAVGLLGRGYPLTYELPPQFSRAKVLQRREMTTRCYMHVCPAAPAECSHHYVHRLLCYRPPI